MTEVINKVLVSEIISYFEGGRVCEWSMISFPRSFPQRNLLQSVGLGIDPSLGLTRGKASTSPPPPPTKPSRNTERGNKSETQFHLARISTVENSPNPQSHSSQPKTQIHNENSRVQCDLCGIMNYIDVHSCANCGNPRSARWMKITQEQQLEFKQSIQPDVLSGSITIKWKQGASAPVHNGYHNAVLYEGKIYIGGGNEHGLTKPSHRIDIYDPKENCWSSSPINVSNHWFAMTVLNNQLMIIGGKNTYGHVTDRVFILGSNNQLRFYTTMITPRCLATAVSHQQNLLVVGGKGSNYHLLASTEIFDSISGQWHMTGDLPSPHCSLQAAVSDNTIYLLGGGSQNSSSSYVFTASLDMLSSKNLKWDSHLSTPWNRSTPVSLQGRELVVVGGRRKKKETGNHNYVHTSDIYVLNKITHNWDAVEQIPSPRVAPVVVSMADTIIVIGGVGDDGQFTDTVWIGSCDPQRLI